MHFCWFSLKFGFFELSRVNLARKVISGSFLSLSKIMSLPFNVNDVYCVLVDGTSNLLM